ncbi:MAG TPA: PP2C family serine/threonine-protein phosphatase [Acidimicrobiales bacterium]|nr:PP2C family serine/threonine-protein phosphatase [Acidimicrobiales bacterium]
MTEDGEPLGLAQFGEPTEGNGVLVMAGDAEKVSWALRSDPGQVRPHNEDFAGAFVHEGPDDAWDRGPLFVVADGLGGHAAGEVASRVAVEGMVAAWRAGSPGPPNQALRTAARAANVAVFDAALERGRRGMGTTLTALTLAGHDAFIAHVGDSRAYLVRGRECHQLTSDHSRVGELLRMRLITPEQAASHPARSMLTRSLGAEGVVQVDLVRQVLEPGDRFVLCSDGLWDTVARAEIAQMVSAPARPGQASPADAARALVELALERKAPDNVTAAVVCVTSDQPIPAASPRRSLFRRGRG